MAAISNRVKAIKANIGNGGVSAPHAAAKGGTTGLGRAQVAPNPGKLGQAQGLGAAPQPGSAPPVQPQPAAPLPWDVAAANSEGAALKKEEDTLSGIASQSLLTDQEYGLTPGYNNYASNPYSRAALLQRSYDNAKRGTLNSAGHNLYAGSYVNHQNSDTHSFNVGRNNLEGEFAQKQAQEVAEKAAAEDAYNEALTEAGWNRVNAGLEAEPEPAAAGGGGAPAKKKQNKRQGQIKQNISQARKAR